MALCDLDPGRLERAAALTPGARLSTDARAAFRDGPIDFVEICTRPGTHPELVAIAAAHGRTSSVRSRPPCPGPTSSR